MNPFLIHGVKRSFRLALIMTGAFLLLYGALVSMYWVYPTKLVIGVLVMTGLVIIVGVSDLFFATYGRFKKYRKLTSRPLETRAYLTDPLTGEPYGRLMGLYEQNGITIHKPLIGAFGKKYAKTIGVGTPVKCALMSNGELALLEKQGD
ncbi:MAG: hypothetical protein LKG11_04410 [Bacilli bacterium]|jgi:hypothetical protein|nr:hypothetical protein [Bacilli bacterium]